MSDRIVADVRRFSKSTGYAKFLLVIIASHIHYKAEYAYPSLDTLAREVTVSKPTVIKLIKRLEALGELEVRRGHGRGQSNRYRITLVHEPFDARLEEDDPDQSKGKAHGNRLAHEAPAEGWDEDDDDQPKGKPYLYLLPPATDTEKVNGHPEKVNDPQEKGKASVNSKEVLRTSKEITERVAMDMEKVNDHTRVRTDDAAAYEYWPNHNPWHRRCGTHHLVDQPCPPVYGREEDEPWPAI